MLKIVFGLVRVSCKRQDSHKEWSWKLFISVLIGYCKTVSFSFVSIDHMTEAT